LAKSKVVIIGGVAGGMSAATRLRRLNENIEIVVLEKSGHVSYANCGLPYYLGGVIKHESALLLQTPQSLHQRFNLDVRVNNEVVSIDPVNKKLTINETDKNSLYELNYDQLILSPGATPVIPPIKGVENAFTLRNVEDVEKIFKEVSKKPNNAVIVGGGFIGVEVAENFVHQNISTVLIEASSQVLAPLDPEMASIVSNEMQKNGIKLILEDSVTEITQTEVVLKSGQRLDSELTILAIGVKPDISLAQSANLEIGPKNGIKVNQFFQTSDPSIFAIGDAVEKEDELTKESTLIPLANIANRQGRVVADFISGKKIRTVSNLGTAIVKVFDLMVATTGWNEKKLIQAKRNYIAIHTHPNNHAGYYPGAKQMSLKILVDSKTHEILGAQGVGVDGVDKRIDVIATAIKAKFKAYELADLELSYAPPFGSAKDPVNMLGYIAENALNKTVELAQWHEIDELIKSGYVLVDVRTKDEYDQNDLPGSINIPLDELRERHLEIGSKKVLIHCQVGLRGHTASMLLNQLGYEAKNLSGGFLTWRNSPAANKLSYQK
jgi:NADPH-dependent 2,4-dienoyl-CoA reductase/sulfur reductase-like enzyme/rhodanese-related sulfurtransferase